MSESRPAEAPGMSSQPRNQSDDELAWEIMSYLNTSTDCLVGEPEHLLATWRKHITDLLAARASVSPPQPASYEELREIPELRLLAQGVSEFSCFTNAIVAVTEAYQLGWRAATVSLPQAPKWECHAAKFKCGYPGGGDPPDCDFPFCGCCPDAEQVISSLVEIGWQEIPVNPLERVAKAIRACEGHPINFGLGKKMSEVLKWIEAEVPTASPSSEAPPASCALCNSGNDSKWGPVGPRKWIVIRGEGAWRHEHERDRMFTSACETAGEDSSRN